MDNNYYKNKINWCPICNQGWVQIFKDKTSHKLVIVCDECFSEWASPEKIDKNNTIPSSNNAIIIEPSEEEIENKGWDKFILK